MKLPRETTLPPLELGRFAALPMGHVVRTLVEEHARILDWLEDLEKIIETIGRGSSWSSVANDAGFLRGIAGRLAAAEPHHQREERVLFARMGERGIVGPPAVMAREHDILRGLEQKLFLVAQRREGDLQAW